MNEIKLIALYYYICEYYNTDLKWHCQRFSNYSSSENITDEELLTLYLFIMLEEEKFKAKSIHSHAKRYFLDWFPNLPTYGSFVKRINRLAPVFSVLVELILQDAPKEGVDFTRSTMDSMPIITCSGKRNGKVAPNLTAKGYCATKNMYYFGAKLHGIGFCRTKKLPYPEFLKITPANEHDLTAIREYLLTLYNRILFGDKAYSDKDLEEILAESNTFILTPIKLVKGEPKIIRQFHKAADDLFSKAVSSVRQPIESLFNWFIEKTNIQKASKVRSEKGLIVHVFSRLAAALLTLIF